MIPKVSGIDEQVDWNRGTESFSSCGSRLFQVEYIRACVVSQEKKPTYLTLERMGDELDATQHADTPLTGSLSRTLDNRNHPSHSDTELPLRYKLSSLKSSVSLVSTSVSPTRMADDKISPFPKGNQRNTDFELLFTLIFHPPIAVSLQTPRNLCSFTK